MTYGFVMNTVRQDFMGPGLAMFLLVLMSYIAGRVHQVFRQTDEREQAFREGYNTASRSLFSLAVQTSKGQPPPPLVTAAPKAKPVKAMKGYASVPAEVRSPLPARHRAQGRRAPGLADTKRYTEWPDVKQAA